MLDFLLFRWELLNVKEMKIYTISFYTFKPRNLCLEWVKAWWKKVARPPNENLLKFQKVSFCCPRRMNKRSKMALTAFDMFRLSCFYLLFILSTQKCYLIKNTLKIFFGNIARKASSKLHKTWITISIKYSLSRYRFERMVQRNRKN